MQSAAQSQMRSTATQIWRTDYYSCKSMVFTTTRYRLLRALLPHLPGRTGYDGTTRRVCNRWHVCAALIYSSCM
jgi:hypothetical protein